jgi:quercetin dioxygenase-like cupin family protein
LICLRSSPVEPYIPNLDTAHKVPSESFEGAITIVEWDLPPGVMIPPHTHSRERECDHVLKGELMCDIGGEIVVAPVGPYRVRHR